jgi:hypothetical protein
MIAYPDRRGNCASIISNKMSYKYVTSRAAITQSQEEK